jgi:hypothetical protein
MVNETMNIETTTIIDSILNEHSDAFAGYQMAGQGSYAAAEKFFNRYLMTELRATLNQLNDDLDGTGVYELHTVNVAFNGQEVEVRFEVPVDLTEMTAYFDGFENGEQRLAMIQRQFDRGPAADGFIVPPFELTPTTAQELQLYAVVADRLASRNREIRVAGVQLTNMAQFLFTIPVDLAAEFDDSLVRSQMGRR